MESTKAKQVGTLSPYLCAGEYASAEEGRIFFLTTESNNPMIVGKYDPAKSQRVLIPEQPKQFAGNILWFTSGGEIKIFSQESVLILCSSEASYQQKIQHYRYFSPFFPVPALQQQNAEKFQLLEERIDFRRITNEDDSLILKAIYQDYTVYFRQQRKKAVEHRFEELLIQHNEKLDPLIREIQPELLATKFPFLMLHGDLWTENILLERDSEKLWYIDWDSAGEYFFCHDFFKFMWNELDVHGNPHYYQNYLAGKYDEAFTQLFDLFQLNFQPQHRKDYFYLSFLSFMLEGQEYSWKWNELADFLDKVVHG